MAKKKECKESKFKGLLVLVCPDCGNHLFISPKEEIDSFLCKKCGKVHSLKDCTPRPIVAFCECGNRIFATTNCTDSVFTFSCKCGYPLDVEYSTHKKKYFGMR